MVVEIRQRAQEIANNSKDEIIMGLYRNMITAHNDFCGCNYCNVLQRYVDAKKLLHRRNRVNKVVESGWLPYSNIKLQQQIDILKKEKDDLKQI
jgi:hypothetical protein